MLNILDNYYHNSPYFIPECPTGWEEWDQFCYKFVRTDLVPMSGAKTACAQDGAYLLSVNSDLEHSFIVQQLDSHDPGQRKCVSFLIILQGRGITKLNVFSAGQVGGISTFWYLPRHHRDLFHFTKLEPPT